MQEVLGHYMDTFNEALQEQGGIEGGVIDSVHVEVWRTAFYRRSTQDNDAKKKAFQRVRQSLTADGWLIVSNDVYRLGPANAESAAIKLANAHRGKAGRGT